MAHNNEGSERLSGDPVILTFALSKEEWAKVAAALTFLVEQADLITKLTGTPKPDTVQDIMDAATMFTRLIHDEMNRTGR